MEEKMRERYLSLQLSELRIIAKTRGLRGISTLKKADLVEELLKLDMEDARAAKAKGEEPPEIVKSVKTYKAEKAAEAKAEQAADAKTEKAAEAKAEQAADAKTEKAADAKTENATEAKAEKTAKTKAEKATDAKDSKASAENTGKSDEKKNESKPAAKTTDVKNDTKEETLENNAEFGSELSEEKESLDSGIIANGILEVMPDGFGFIRSDNFLPGEADVYVAPSQIRRFNLKTGDVIVGNTRVKTQGEKFSALLYVKTVNGVHPSECSRRPSFEDLTPIFPNERIRLEMGRSSVAMRIMDLLSPVGKGQRGMIVSPPKAGKTTLLKEVAKSITGNYPDMHLIILLIDERPEEVTDIKESVEGKNVEVIYSTFDELPEHHKRVSEMVIERGKRLVEHGRDVVILLDSITRLARAYNLTVPPSGRTLSGGLDPAALHMPKRFFGAARNMRQGGSLTILATALVETGSKMDDVVYEEFKGTGNMEMILDRKLQEKRVFPAIDIPRSGTRREDLLLTADEQMAVNSLRKGLNGIKVDEAVEKIIDLFSKTNSNREFVDRVNKTHLFF